MPDKFKTLLTIRNIISVVAVLLIVYGSYATLKVIAYNYTLQKDIDKLREEVELLKLKNLELSYSITYYQTDAFVDREARDKLGLQAPGEQVVIFPDKIPRGLEVQKTPEQIAQEKSFTERSKSNLDQWLYFLLKKQPKS